MLAAVWADRWERYLNEGEDDEARDALEQSQMLYEEGFRKVPTDTYTGINAASKAAMLGDLEKAKQLAQEVLTILEEQAEARGGAPAPEYWERVTEPEALLLLGQHDRAYALYHEARVAHQTEKGNLESTGQQIKRLLAVVPIQEEIQSKLKREFRLKD
jgi:tetratricopeptide (TPR) repeat protein